MKKSSDILFYLKYSTGNYQNCSFYYNGKEADCWFIDVSNSGILCKIETELVNVLWKDIPLKIIAQANTNIILNLAKGIDNKISDLQSLKYKLMSNKSKILKEKKLIKNRITNKEKKFVAEKYWRIWADINSPSDLEKSKIEIYRQDGTLTGSSSDGHGSIIWTL